jgi:hypothetical protein
VLLSVSFKHAIFLTFVTKNKLLLYERYDISMYVYKSDMSCKVVWYYNKDSEKIYFKGEHEMLSNNILCFTYELEIIADILIGYKCI